jgi:RNA polymerase sigma factor (sigma-70 family)
LTEQELIKDCIKKNAIGERMLFEKYAGIMLTVCRRYARDQHEAEDMLQEAFIRVFTYIHKYRFEGSLEGWIKRIVVNVALKIIQTKKLFFSEVSEDHQALPSIDSSALSNLSANEMLQLIGHLPEGYRIVFNLYVMEGYSHDEIGEMLHIKPATSRSQLSKARALLKEQIMSTQKLPSKYD